MRPTLPVSSPVLVLAFDTWRLAWREVMTRVELAMLLILAVVSGVAAVGSPTPADASVQMLAVCLAVVPFALVLVAGQIWRRPDDEVALYARPLSALTYVSGRGLGLLAIGVVQLAAVNLVGDATLFAVARLGLVSSAMWDAGWSLLVVGPSLVLVVGGTLYLVARTGGGARYYTPAIVASLLLALVEYKLPGIARATSLRLELWSPFPGLLTLGLAMPAALLHPVAGWLVGNRILYLAVGVGLGMLAAWQRGKGRETPLPAVRPLQIAAAVTAAAVLAAMVALQAAAAALSPGTLPPSVLQAASAGTAPLSPGTMELAITVRPASGRLSGIAVWTGPVTGPSAAIYLWLNAGLRVTGAHDGSTPLDVVREESGAVLSGTASSLWLLSGGIKSGAPLTIAYQGRLLPAPTFLPTPPFRPGISYEGAFTGQHSLYLDGEGGWYPRLMAPNGGGAPLPGSTSIRLTVIGSAGTAGFTTLSEVGHTDVYTLPSGSPWPSVLWLSGPYQPTSVGKAVVAASPGVSLGGLDTYIAAWPSLSPWLPNASARLDAVVSPIATQPLLADSLLAVPGDNPYCTSLDPVAGTCGTAAATDVTARLLLAALSWQNVLGVSGGNVPALAPAPAQGDQRQQILPVLAALSAYKSLSGAEAMVVAEAWTKGADLPIVGVLDATERAQAQALLASPAFQSSSALNSFAASLSRVGVQNPLTWAEVTHDAS